MCNIRLTYFLRCVTFPANMCCLATQRKRLHSRKGDQSIFACFIFANHLHLHKVPPIRVPIRVGQSKPYLCILDQSMKWGVGQARRDDAVGLLPVFCCWLLGLCDRLRQTDGAMPAYPVAAAVLLLGTRGARLAVVAMCLVECQRHKKTLLGRSYLAPKVVWRRHERWSTQAAPELLERGWGCRWICT